MALARSKAELYRSRGVTIRPARGGWKTVDTAVYTRPFVIQIQHDEDGWLIAIVPELPGCYTQARTKRELFKRIWEAIDLALQDTSDQVIKRGFSRAGKWRCQSFHD